MNKVIEDSEYVKAGYTNPNFYMLKQMDKKQAWVLWDSKNKVYALKSYDTIVSVYDPNKNGGCDNAIRLGRWSSTTSRHQGIFEGECMWYRHHKENA